jgi:HrpA-like RNA helicase
VNPYEFPFLDKPPAEAIDFAFTHLFYLRAIDSRQQLLPNDYVMELNTEGMAMGRMALDPKMARALIASVHYKCIPDMLGIAALFGEERRMFRCPNKDADPVVGVADTSVSIAYRKLGLFRKQAGRSRRTGSSSTPRVTSSPWSSSGGRGCGLDTRIGYRSRPGANCATTLS